MSQEVTEVKVFVYDDGICKSIRGDKSVLTFAGLDRPSKNPGRFKDGGTENIHDGYHFRDGILCG